MPGEYVVFARDDVLPSYWANALQHFLSTAAPNFRLQQTAGSDVTIEVPATDPSDIPAIAIAGPIRYNAATIQAAHPGGAAGTYPVFVTAKANDVRGLPVPFSDFTDYSFGLVISAVGGHPAIVAGVVDMYRQVGEVDWDGAKITALRQFIGYRRSTDPIQPTALRAGEVPAAITGAVGQTADLLRVQTSDLAAKVRVTPSGVLRAIGDLVANDGAASQAALSSAVGGQAALALGAAADAVLYRQQAGVLRTDGGLSVGSSAIPTAGQLVASSDITAQQGGVAQSKIGSIAGAAGIQLEGDTDLTRGSAGVLRTSGLMNAIGGYQVNSVALAASHLSNGTSGTGAVLLANNPAINSPTLSGTVTLPSIVSTSTTLGFYGVTPVVRAAARNQTNWAVSRAIDRNTASIAQTLDYLCTLVDDLRKLGLVA